MSILVDRETRLCVSGITGREGSFHTRNNKAYGTNVVSGVTPGKGGQDVDGIPVFDTFHEAVRETGANTAMVFVPPRFAADSILEAEDAGVALIVAITEGIPAHDELRVYNHLARTGTARLVGPNCPGILSPGKANVGIIPAAFFKEGDVGVVSRSGTLTYQIGNELAQRGFGNSSIVGIGGDPVPGTSFVDTLALFEADDETRVIVMAGEIGGSAEEEAADVHRRARHQARRGLHRGRHRAARQDDGPRRRDRLGHQRHGRRQAGRPGGTRRARRPDAHRGRGDRRRPLKPKGQAPVRSRRANTCRAAAAAATAATSMSAAATGSNGSAGTSPIVVEGREAEQPPGRAEHGAEEVPEEGEADEPVGEPDGGARQRGVGQRAEGEEQQGRRQAVRAGAEELEERRRRRPAPRCPPTPGDPRRGPAAPRRRRRSPAARRAIPAGRSAGRAGSPAAGRPPRGESPRSGSRRRG